MTTEELFISSFYGKPIIEIFKNAGVKLWHDKELIRVVCKDTNTFEICLTVQSNSIENIMIARENCENTMLKDVKHIITATTLCATDKYVIEDIYIRLKVNTDVI